MCGLALLPSLLFIYSNVRFLVEKEQYRSKKTGAPEPPFPRKSRKESTYLPNLIEFDPAVFPSSTPPEPLDDSFPPTHTNENQPRATEHPHFSAASKCFLDSPPPTSPAQREHASNQFQYRGIGTWPDWHGTAGVSTSQSIGQQAPTLLRATVQTNHSSITFKKRLAISGLVAGGSFLLDVPGGEVIVCGLMAAVAIKALGDIDALHAVIRASTWR